MPAFFFKLNPPRPTFPVDMSDDERAMMGRHAEYWRGLMADDHAVAFGPVDDPTGSYGIGIVVTDSLEHAMAVRDGDPVVTSGVGFTVDILPMLALVTPNGDFA